MRALTLLAAFAAATGLFWATMLTAPPTSEARAVAGIDVRDLTIQAKLDEGAAYDAF
ncbi:hypothetical protein OPKNFCMD_2969 [Methylobacterium crusticola]|uniref:Uncharacterized protein n=1 Tax=Methylobacterium crusticola TaxID=1697972 RepID=A0ABQ4QXW2_9HYPH|nr:hypothetical protein [Methylobacterium crusticola]GJD50232.1 hypothetical protein OPKNFCMD_2969 [Methylobacterium crusticola]